MINAKNVKSNKRRKQHFMKFSEAVKSYSQWKLENKGTSKVSSKELAALRKQYREGNIVDTKRRPTSMREGAALLRRYSSWKLKEHGTSKVTEAERRLLLKESASLREPKVSLSREIKKYSEWKEMNHGTSKVTMREVAVLKKHLLRESECEDCEPQQEEQPEAGEEKLTESTIRESMREARKAIYRAKKALREGDMAMAQDATMDAADAMPPADGVADAAAQGAVPQNIVDAVSAIQASVNDLATQCGIEPPVDPAADPNAGVPAVDGVADPNAAAGAPAGADPMMEAKDLKDVKNRLKEREERINSVKAMNTVQNPLADIGDTVNPEMYAARKVNKTDSPDTVPTPSTQSLISGTEKGATKWPTEKLNVRESSADAYLERRIQESKDAEDFSWAKILQSGILG